MWNFLYKIQVRIRIAEGGFRSRFLSDKRIGKLLFFICVGVFFCGAIFLGIQLSVRQKDEEKLNRQQQELARLKEEALDAAIVKRKQQGTEESEISIEEAVYEIVDKNTEEKKEDKSEEKQETKETSLYAENGMLIEYEPLYEKNPDVVGWLTVKDTVIDYPVMQTLQDEEFYLRKDFYKEENQNGSLIMDTDSVVGIGRKKTRYANGRKPSTNLIIHGHTMKTGAMFGTLERYKQEKYGKEHKILCFDSLYEKREYELIAAFYTQVYKAEEKTFKYYQFFQADTPGEFDDWYKNIKKLSIYDTGVTAEFGDEFLTLSCCAYPSKDKRFVVVGKRIK